MQCMLIVFLILMTVYVSMNKDLKDGTKTGWWIFISVVGVFYLLTAFL